MVKHAFNERMARRVEYLQEEVRVLRQALTIATGKSRILFTPEQRRRLAIIGKALTRLEPARRRRPATSGRSCSSRDSGYVRHGPPHGVLRHRVEVARGADRQDPHRSGRPPAGLELMRTAREALALDTPTVTNAPQP